LAFIKTVWELLKETISDWSQDKASRLAAALAYYTTFSIAPLLVIVIAIVGLIFGREAVQGQIEAQIQGMVGEDSAELIQEMIQGTNNPTSGTIATVIGLATLLFGATGVFAQLQDALNTIWEVEPKPGRGLMGIVIARFTSFTMVLGIGFLLMVSLVVSAGLAALTEFLQGNLSDIAWLAQIVNFIISFGVITLLFAMIYKLLPDVKIAWSDVWIGAAVTALLFTLGKFLIGLYLGHSEVASSYGAAGALIVMLLWVYYSAQILFLGAEFTQVYAKRFGSRIVPAEHAVPTTEEARAQQGMAHSKRTSPTAPDREK
jgi:membrane protein